MSASASAPPLLTLTGIHKRFANGTEALAGVELQIRAGEFLALLGPSGCGKSTVLRLIAGLTAASSGQVQWMHQGDASAPSIGFVFQEPTLMPWASVFDNVWLPLRLAGVLRSDAATRITPLLTRLGLAAFSEVYPRELSGGMKMRVSIARALVTRPAVLLMDEPFAALDEITRFALNRDLLALSAEQGFTTVFVTHSVYESVFLADRVCVMSARPGRVVAQIDIDAPAPREAAFRHTPQYASWCAEVSDALTTASGVQA
ncbi:ABC transporter ATP-binding protein [Piscinibacterium candidicorallinum]|uniref:ABC transporter ATP-binding protein n=1 Tax=Piscinibacterium candidicorallinum TaxID=1793872 RepID=A0ABV7H3Y2_9BURK